MCGVAGCVVPPRPSPGRCATWRAFARYATGHNVLALWTTEIWCRLMLERQDREGVEAELWRS